MAQCHSAAMFHDYRLRGGSAGSFSLAATRRNYALSVAQMSFESEDVNASRLVRKNLYGHEISALSSGIAHRGGPLLEDFNGRLASGDLCDQRAFDYDNAPVDTIPAYCVVREWHKRERRARNPAPLTAIVYVKRPLPPAPDRAARLRRVRGRRELARRPGDPERRGRSVSGGGRDAGRVELRYRGFPGHPPPGRVVGRQANRLCGARGCHRSARHLRDGDRWGRMREAARHRAARRERQRPLGARLRSELQSPGSRRKRTNRVRVDPRQPRFDGVRLHRPPAHARRPDEAEREPLRPRARPEQPGQRARAAADLAAQHGALPQLHARRATRVHDREARAWVLSTRASPAKLGRRRLPPSLRAEIAALATIRRPASSSFHTRISRPSSATTRRNTGPGRSRRSTDRSASTSRARSRPTTRSILASSIRARFRRPRLRSSSTPSPARRATARTPARRLCPTARSW